MEINSIIKNIWVVGLLMLSLSCQEESIKVDLPDEDEQLSTQAASFLSRVSLKDGSNDNIIDGGSCISIQLPIEVLVNDTLINIYTEDDYELVEDILDEYDNDQDTVIIQFPITVNFADYTSGSINDLETLEELIDDCIEEGFDDDIECIDIIYPIQISSYNTQLQQAKVIDLINDETLYTYLDNVSDGLIINLIYPISLLTYNDEIIVVNDQNALVNAILEFEDSCDEDDDLDFDDDDIELDGTDLFNNLLYGDWVVSNYDSVGIDRTDSLSAYSLNFQMSDLITVSSASEELEGEWRVYSEDQYLNIRIDVDAYGPLTLLNREWRVVSYSDVKISLKNLDIEVPLRMDFQRP